MASSKKKVPPAFLSKMKGKNGNSNGDGTKNGKGYPEVLFSPPKKKAAKKTAAKPKRK